MIWLLCAWGLALASEPAVEPVAEEPSAPSDPVGEERPFEITAEDPEERARQAEIRRLGEEMVAHATAGRQAALLRTYRSLLAVTSDVDPELHFVAAEAAVAHGELLYAVARLQRVQGGEREEEARGTLASLRERTGLVRLSAPVGAVLTCPPRFVPDEQAAVEAAAAELAATGAYLGLLPAVTCDVGGQAFDIPAGGRVGLVVDY